MAFEISSQMSVVIAIKILLAIFLLLISVVSAIAYSRFKEFHILLPKFDDGELLGYVIISGFIGAIMEAYGSVVCYLQCNYTLRPIIRPSVDVLVVWDVAMSLKFVSSADGFFGAMSKYRTDEKIRSLLSVMHVTYGCCGNFNYSEWYKVNWKTSMSQHVVGFPESCCNKMAAQMLNDMCVAEIPYQEMSKLLPIEVGCLELLRWWYKFYLFALASLFSIVAFIQPISVILSGWITSRTTSNIYQDEREKLLQHSAIFQLLH